jgi:hypothetical protein
MEDASNLEKRAGSLAAGVAGTAVSALGSSITPLAAFVPFLLQSLATKRQSARIDKALKEINAILMSHGDAIRELSDPKYKLIGESISAVFQTVDKVKIEYLKNAINRAITSPEITEKNADYLSRIIRDISASEARFLIENFQYEKVFFGEGDSSDKTLVIHHGSEEEIIVAGLINMGLLYSKVPTMDSVRFEFSPIVVKLIVLIKNA